MPCHDMLVKLYDQNYGLNYDQQSILELRTQGIEIRKPIGPEKHHLLQWVEDNFSSGWASELDTALSNRPVSYFIAQHKTSILGFACYDATALGFFGPLGVIQSERGKGIGKTLTKACLMDMQSSVWLNHRISIKKWQELFKSSIHQQHLSFLRLF
ncbi:MAG: GNAT family N-acetyltransferase [Thiohalomonas sp.]|nr:GNAT family N-acetyltransferase [Thiohalomonas sp.]